MSIVRCSWAQSGDLHDYHDREWGVPNHDDVALYEFMTLEGAQAGLSWLTVLRRREGYRRAFANFNPRIVSTFDEHDILRLLTEDGIIRHRGKIESTIANATAILELQQSGGSLDAALWSFATERRDYKDSVIGATAFTAASSAMSKQLKRLGFGFVGPTTCYSLMQAAGLVNDHQTDCFRFAELEGLR